MSPIDTLAQLFKTFPGIGERQARRFVYFLLGRDAEARTKLAQAIAELENTITQCEQCQRFFPVGSTPKKRCAICSDSSRDQSLVMIVEKDTDLENIEASKTYTGIYFVLGGVLPIRSDSLDDAPYLRAKALDAIITSLKPQEIILGFSTSPEGEHTADRVTRMLLRHKFETPCTISKLGRGLSSGAELEYADPATLKAALESRSS